MQLISTAGGILRTQSVLRLGKVKANSFGSTLTALNELLPDDGLSRGAVHEILSDANTSPWFFALLLAHATRKITPENFSKNYSDDSSQQTGVIVCSDPHNELFPPALSATLPMDRLFLLRIENATDHLWALCQCLACKSVSAVIAYPKKLSRIQARRLQLAAETGGGVGVLLRDVRDVSSHYAAATRWLVQPAPGDQASQRWNVQLIHGHGGKVGKQILLEVSRDIFHPNHVRAIDPLAHRPNLPQTAKASA